MPDYFNVIELIFIKIHQLLNHFVFDGYHQMARVLEYPIALSIVLYIVLLGYSVSQGWLSLSMSELIKQAVKLAVIYTLSLNWDIFSKFIVQLFQEGSDQISFSLLASFDGKQTLNSPHELASCLQSVLIHFVKIGYWLWRRGAWNSLSPCLEAMAIWGAGLLLVGVSVIQLIIADVMLSLLFTLAPFFVALTLFSCTQNLFDRWLGYLFAYALLKIFMAITLSFLLNIAQWSVSGIHENNLLTSLNITSFVPISLICCVCIALIRRVEKISYEIGLSFSSVSSLRSWSERVADSLQLIVATRRNK